MLRVLGLQGRKDIIVVAIIAIVLLFLSIFSRWIGSMNVLASMVATGFLTLSVFTLCMAAFWYGGALYRHQLFHDTEMLTKELSSYFCSLRREFLPEVCPYGGLDQGGFSAVFELSGVIDAEDSIVPIRDTLLLALENMQRHCNSMDNARSIFLTLMEPITQVAGRVHHSEESMDRWKRKIEEAISVAKAEIACNKAFNDPKLGIQTVSSDEQPSVSAASL